MLVVTSLSHFQVYFSSYYDIFIHHVLDYPYEVPRIVYTGETYFHLLVDTAASPSHSPTPSIPVSSASPSSSTGTTYMDESFYTDFSMMTLDPLKWKEQDHYQLLGLSLKRHEASEGDIKKAYRKMILKYHPDKKNNLAKMRDEQGLSPVSSLVSPVEDEDNIFKCIQKGAIIFICIQQLITYL
jgi:hypothetical protein